MLKNTELLEQLLVPERLALVNAIGAGLHDARQAAECYLDPGRPQVEDVAQFLAYLSGAVRQLEAARAIVRRHA